MFKRLLNKYIKESTSPSSKVDIYSNISYTLRVVDDSTYSSLDLEHSGYKYTESDSDPIKLSLAFRDEEKSLRHLIDIEQNKVKRLEANRYFNSMSSCIMTLYCRNILLDYIECKSYEVLAEPFYNVMNEESYNRDYDLYVYYYVVVNYNPREKTLSKLRDWKTFGKYEMNYEYPCKYPNEVIDKRDSNRT